MELDLQTINRFASELDEKSYNKYYPSLVTGKSFKESSDIEVKKDGDDVTLEGEDVPQDMSDESVSLVGKIGVKLIELIEEKMTKIKTIDIVESEGDITKLPYNDQFEAVASIVETLEHSQGVESRYINIYLDNYNMLQKRKKEFRKAFKDSDRNLLSLFYIGMVLYHIEMTTILSSALLKWVEDGTSIDQSIQSREEFKKLFLKVQDVLADDDLNDFMKVDFNESIIGESNVSGDMLLYYSETSINDTIKLFKLGLAKFLHKIAGLLRFIIYIFFYAKFSIQQKIQKINSVIKLYETDDKDERQQLMREAKELNREFKVSTIEATDRARKKYEKEKIEIEDEEGFAL